MVWHAESEGGSHPLRDRFCNVLTEGRMHKSRIGIFTGEDRLATLAPAGRMVRMGSLTGLASSDFDRVCALLAAHDIEAAQTYCEYLYSLHSSMITSYVEWVQRWFAFVTARACEADARMITLVAHQEWSRSALSVYGAGGTEMFGLIGRMLDPLRIESALGAAKGYWLTSEPQESFCLDNDDLRCKYQEILEAAGQGSLVKAVRLFRKYMESARQRHDLLVLFIGAYTDAVNVTFGQEAVEDGLQYSLERCSFYPEFWGVLREVGPAETALLMAEEFRAHFSGPDRRGSVEIVEEPYSYHLVLDPCGSGGVLRRSLAESEGQHSRALAQPSPCTWGRRDEVPAYCAHCAQNELTAVKHFGYPLWVTEFDPDWRRPCGWTIYKDPRYIPDIYVTRLGIE
jgi:hypothetical protein